MRINSIGEAGRYVEQILINSGSYPKRVVPVNRGRHAIIATDEKIYYLLYKRLPFQTYGQHFQGGGYGESINIECFNSIARSEKLDTILFINPDGKVYHIPKKRWSEWAEKNQTVRIQNQGETTTSIPLNLLTRWETKQENHRLPQYTSPHHPDPTDSHSPPARTHTTRWRRFVGWLKRLFTKKASDPR